MSRATNTWACAAGRSSGPAARSPSSRSDASARSAAVSRTLSGASRSFIARTAPPALNPAPSLLLQRTRKDPSVPDPVDRCRSVGAPAVSVATGLDIEALYQQYRVRIFRAIAGVVFDDAAAEDLTQEAFERAWRSRASFRAGPDEVGAWLYRIAMNAAMSWLRRQRLARLLPMRLL